MVKSLHGGMPYVAPTDMPAYKAAEKAVEATFGRKPLPFYSGGSIPIISGFIDKDPFQSCTLINRIPHLPLLFKSQRRNF